MISGTWPEDCIQRAFVEGAKWFREEQCGTFWPSVRASAEAEAIRRYGDPVKKKDYSQPKDPYGIEAEYTSQSAAVDVRGNSGTGPRSLPTQAEADAENRKINEEAAARRGA